MNNIKLLIFENIEFLQLETGAICCPFVEICDCANYCLPVIKLVDQHSFLL
jgi:hypothetical protein